MSSAAEALNPRNPPRVVNPRKLPQSYERKPIIAVDGQQILLERTGEIHSIDELAGLTVSEPSSIIVCQQSGLLLARLNDEFKDHPRWQFRVSPIEREVYSHGREKRGTIRDTVPVFWGFQRANGHSKSKYHYPLDPSLFCRKTIAEILPERADYLGALLEWATDVRGFCEEHRLTLRSTAGGIAGQLLKDPRFYPEPRRKVPAATNARAREYMPGNHYRLYTETQKVTDAIYFDQNRAHHNAARNVDLPDADGLFARGFFHKTDDHRIWAKPHTELYKRTIAQHGMFKLKAYIPHLPKGTYAPPCMDEPGERYVYVFSNEIEWFERCGGRIFGIVAAWTSIETDKGLKLYSKWATDTLDDSAKARQAWLKPLLLASYGLLASRPRKMEVGYCKAKSGERKRYPIGGQLIEVWARVGKVEREMGTTNVIQRAMIEAETRKRSLEFATDLHVAGCDVLSVYADSVFIGANCQLPMVSPDWKVQAVLSNLKFFNPVQFSSHELTKLPGVPEAKTRDYISRVNSLVASVKNLEKNRARKVDKESPVG